MRLCIRSAASRPLRRLLPFLVAVLAGAGSAARAELVFDNSANDLKAFVTHTTEFGDEVDLAGSARLLRTMAVQVFAEAEVPLSATARIRIYRNNGPFPAPPAAQIAPPGELLYQSPEIPIRAGVQVLRITDLAVALPAKLTWTLQFQGTGSTEGQRAGPQVYHPPVVGSSFKDYWVHDSDRWRLYVLASGPASFAATFDADPDPPLILTPLDPEGGHPAMRVTGPIGSEPIIEVSLDLARWQAVGVADLTRTNATTFVDDFAAAGAPIYYRARPTAERGVTAVLRGLRPRVGGGQTVHLSGSPRTVHVLEATTDFVTWTTVGDVHFTGNKAVLDDPVVPPGGLRFYRTRLLPPG